MTEALAQVRRLAQEHGNDLAFVVNHSGGKDSTRMMGLVRQMFPDFRLMPPWRTPALNINCPSQPQTGHVCVVPNSA